VRAATAVTTNGRMLRERFCLRVYYVRGLWVLSITNVEEGFLHLNP